jgi:hypothetical protein
MHKKSNPRIGSILDGFLNDMGLLEELQIQASREVLAWQFQEAMEKRGLSNDKLVKILRTSRT